MIDLDRATPAPAWLAQLRRTECLLCGEPTSYTSVYLPGPASVVAPPPGKGRMIIYSLCRGCAEHLDTLAPVIEAKIEKELRDAQVV